MKENMDRDSILMLSLSVLWIVISCGLVLLWHSILVYRVARQHYPPPKYSVWLIFGLQLTNNRMAPEYQQRIDIAMATLNVIQPEIVIFQGGLTGNNTVTEACIGQDYFNQCLAQKYLTIFDSPSLVLEDQSKNSLENLKNTREYLQSEGRPLKVVLVTSDYHLRRCHLMADGLGFQTEFLSAGSLSPFSVGLFKKIILEAFFINWYQTGKFISLIFRNQRMLDRIR